MHGRRGVERGEANACVAPELAAHHIDSQFALLLTQRVLGVDPERIRAQARLAVQALLPAAQTRK